MAPLPEPEEETISWNFHTLDTEGAWKTDINGVAGHLGEMVKFEGRTLAQCFQMPHCHPVDAEDANLDVKARNRLENLNIHGPLAQIPIGGKGRIWGYTRRNVFCALWVDEEHTVYPVKNEGHRRK